MDQQTIKALGQYLNDNLNLETCDNTLKLTSQWLLAMEVEDLDAIVSWLEEKEIHCDCEVVLKLYIPAREKEFSEI